jgi:predicted DCC family thiol-disulfide oxidoreductase YuxK
VWVRARDRAGRVLALPNQTPALIARLGLTRADVDRAAWAIDRGGRRYCAAAAVNRVLAELPRWWFVARLAGVPPLFWLEDRAYYWFAAHRHRFARFGAVPECSVPGVPCTPLGE